MGERDEAQAVIVGALKKTAEPPVKPADEPSLDKKILPLFKPPGTELAIPRSVDTVAGVDRDLVEQVMGIFRDVYHLATQANVLLEFETGTSGINVAITNQRDAITHLVTLLRVADEGRDAQVKQVANLEEHLRRAIIEPYELAIALARKRVKDSLPAYKKDVLESAIRKAIVPSPPTLDQITVRYEAIDKKRTSARLGKFENRHNETWLQAAETYIRTFEDTKKLAAELEGFVVQARGLKASRRSTVTTWLVGVIGILAGAGIGWYFWKLPTASPVRPPSAVSAPK